MLTVVWLGLFYLRFGLFCLRWKLGLVFFYLRFPPLRKLGLVFFAYGSPTVRKLGLSFLLSVPQP